MNDFYLNLMNMKLSIPYDKKVLKFHRTWRILGIFYVLIGLVQVFLNPQSLTSYFYFVLGLITIALYLKYYKKDYLTIEDGVLRRNDPFPKRIKLSEVTCIKKFAGEYTFITPGKALTIGTEYVDKDSLKDLEEVLNNLPVKIEEIPVNRWVDLKAAH